MSNRQISMRALYRLSGANRRDKLEAIPRAGEVTERPKVRHWKCRVGVKPHRGFESRPLRLENNRYRKSLSLTDLRDRFVFGKAVVRFFVKECTDRYPTKVPRNASQEPICRPFWP